MNPTPTIVQITAEPNAMPIWWVFPALVAVIWLAFFALRYQDRLNAKQQLDVVKAAADAEESEYRRARLELQTACVLCDRADLIVPRHKTQSEVTA